MQQQALIEALTVKKRKKVPVKSNTKFANIDIVVKARAAAELLETREATRATEFDAEQASRELLNQRLEPCLVEFQI